MSAHFDEIRLHNLDLTNRLLGLIGKEPVPASEPASLHSPQDADALVGHIEINDHHGVGVLLLRLFGGAPNLISIRSRDYYGGRQDFGAMHVRISHEGASRAMVIWNVLEALNGATIRRVLAVPYFEDDALNAIALKQSFGVPLCTFLMDDQNLYSDGISDSVMAELLRESSFRLAISPEMCVAYEAKYGCRMWFMPPLAPARLIPPQLSELPEQALRDGQPIILGNIWGQQWLKLLRTTVRDTGVTLRWYNNGTFPGLDCRIEDLKRDGIVPQEGPPEPDETFVDILRRAPYVVVPSGTLEENDDRKFIAQLSFPSRIPYILATSHTPVLVLGSAWTAAARIVTRFGIGTVAPYRRREFLDAVERITRPDVNRVMRRAAFLLSRRFSDLGAAEWIWQSLEKGAPVDDRYQEMMSDPHAGSEAGAGRQGA